MKGLIGKKLGMTQIFSADGEAVPVTVLEIAPSTVLQVKTLEKDGYEAIQIGYGQKKLHRQSKANRTRAEAAGLEAAPLRVREFRTPDASRFSVGDAITVDFFQIGDRVKVRGTSKGRGFTGAMKRHGFGGGTRASHGGGPSHRGVGSAGMSATPAHTMKGRRLPGQYGNTKVTEKNLTVVEVNAEEQILIVRGSVPGPVSGLVRIELVGSEPRLYTPASGFAAVTETTVDEPAADDSEPEPTAGEPPADEIETKAAAEVPEETTGDTGAEGAGEAAGENTGETVGHDEAASEAEEKSE